MMEQSTKTILWVVAFITLPITIPLTIISIGIVLTILFLILGLVAVYIKEIVMATGIVILGYGVFKWMSRNE